MQILRENIFTFVNNILFALGIALVAVGRPFDALVSLGVISTNVIVGIVQEIRAKRTLDRVALLTRPPRRSCAPARRCELAPEDLVLGDLVALKAGDQIVLDGRLVDGRHHGRRVAAHGRERRRPQAGRRRRVQRQLRDDRAPAATSPRPSRRAASRTRSPPAPGRSGGSITPLQAEINLVIRVVLGIVLYLEVLLVIRGIVQSIGAGRRRRRRDAAGRARPQRPVRVDRRGLRPGRDPDPPVRGAGAAVELDRVAQPRRRPVPRQDRHADREPARRSEAVRAARRRAGGRGRSRPCRRWRRPPSARNKTTEAIAARWPRDADGAARGGAVLVGPQVERGRDRRRWRGTGCRASIALGAPTFLPVPGHRRGRRAGRLVRARRRRPPRWPTPGCGSCSSRRSRTPPPSRPARTRPTATLPGGMRPSASWR